MVQRALLVGIDQYPDPRNNLNSCVADTLAFRDALAADPRPARCCTWSTSGASLLQGMGEGLNVGS
jgi:hypothetical protein